jgi:hypothetical protein
LKTTVSNQIDETITDVNRNRSGESLEYDVLEQSEDINVMIDTGVERRDQYRCCQKETKKERKKEKEVLYR